MREAEEESADGNLKVDVAGAAVEIYMDAVEGGHGQRKRRVPPPAASRLN